MYPSGSKNDPLDTDVQIELLVKHRDRLQVWKPDTEETRLLQFLVEDRRRRVDQQGSSFRRGWLYPNQTSHRTTSVPNREAVPGRGRGVGTVSTAARAFVGSDDRTLPRDKAGSCPRAERRDQVEGWPSEESHSSAGRKGVYEE
jgi:hypothetical protein